MSRYRVRAFTARREPVILKIVADNPYDAAAQAGKQIASEHPDILRTLDQLSVRKMADSKVGAVYIGKVSTPRARKSKKTAPAAASAPAASKPASPKK